MKVINGTTSSPNTWVYKLEVTETATDIANRTSTIKVEHFLGRHTGQSTSYFAGTLTFKTTITGYTAKTTTKYVNSGDLAPGKWKSLGSHTFVVSNTGTPTTIAIAGTHATSQFTPASASASGTMDLTILHQQPDITDVTIVERNTTIKNLGVLDDEIVNLLSLKRITITATAYDNANITHYYVYNDDGDEVGNSTSNVIDIDFSNYNIQTGGLLIRVTDDQQGETYLQELYTFIEYQKPSLNSAITNIKRQTGGEVTLTESKALINLSGAYYYGDNVVGLSNSVKTYYKVWTGSTETNYIEITDQTTIMNGTATINGYQISGIDWDKKWNYKLYIEDNFGNSYTISGTIAVGRALWSEYPTYVDFYEIKRRKINLVDENEIYYKTGDIEEITGNLVLGAYITSSTTELNFTITTPKRLDNITSITADSIYITARGISGYLNSESGYHEFVGRSGYTITVSKSNENSITIAIRKSSAWTNVTNNTPCAVHGNFKFTLN